MTSRFTGFFLFILCMYCHSLRAQETIFETSGGKETATYRDIIDWYRMLDAKYPQVSMMEIGPTDSDYPLHLVLVGEENPLSPGQKNALEKITILINNGIHPGEPDGIDACMMLVRDLASGKRRLPDNVRVAVIPVYNIGGCLNRNAYTRVNQDGPLSYGFRGNGQNLDLNRDFTKCDSREALSFTRLFQMLQPDVLIDTHVSDGADFQHVMTLISTQYDKLGYRAGPWMRDVFEPELYRSMKKKKWDLAPYVEFNESDPRKGMTMFYDPPRYSSGYAALFGTLSYITETHMLKPFGERVRATYDMLQTFIETCGLMQDSILDIRRNWKQAVQQQKSFPLAWVNDSSRTVTIPFKGYEQDSMRSEATGFQRMYYNHNRPFEAEVPYYPFYLPVKKISKPTAYIIPQGWKDVLERLRLNRVEMTTFQKDTVATVETYFIEDYSSYSRPYEKHHKNHQVKVFSRQVEQWFQKGDVIIFTNQPSNRYIVEMLEPTGDDSFFAWNFFDAILQQKEGYSDYRWEELAAEELKRDSVLREKLEKKRAADPNFAKNPSQILNYIYKNSKYSEKAFLRYPVFRLL